MGATRPNVYGGAISVSDSQSLANLDVAGLPPGTTVWNEDVGKFFKLTTCARRVIELDPADEYADGVFTLANGDFTAADETSTLVVQLDYPNNGFTGHYYINAVNSATEVELLPATAGTTIAPIAGAVTVVSTGPSETDVTVSVQAGAVFGVVWRVVVTTEAENAVTADGPSDAVEFMDELQAANDVIVTQAIASVNLDIPDLDGETDGDYELSGVLLLTGDAGTNSVLLQINNAATTVAGQDWYSIANAAPASVADTVALLAFCTNTANSTAVFKATLTSKSGRVRIFTSDGLAIQTDASFVKSNAIARYDTTATEITGLRIVSSQLLRVGSFVRLRKLRNQT